MMRDVAHQIRRTRYSGTGFLLAIGTLFPTIAHAGVGIWTSNGPYEPSRSVLALAIDPSTPATLYAGTYRAGVFKSTDSGATWAAANMGLTIRDVYALAIDPATPATLYAGGFRGVSKSTDSGATWAAAGLTSQIVNVLAIDPVIPSTVYAGTFSGGVFKSTDSAATWAATSLADTSVNALAINPANPATLYAGGQGPPSGIPAGSGRGVFRSADSGRTWAPVGLNNFFISALAIDPVTPSTLYAGRTGGVVGDKVFKSTDSGGTWVNAGLTNLDPSALAIDPANPATLYAATGRGVFKSTDSGGTWAAVNVGLTNVWLSALAIDPLTTVALYAGTVNSGVFKSTNSGGNWVPANTGLTGLDVNALAISRSTPATLYAATSGGAYADEVFKSTDSGGTWIATGALLYDTTVLALATDPSTPATLYAGTIYGGVFKSTDSGVTWGAANAGMNGLTVRALVIDPSTPATLYAGTNGGLFKSTDSGGTWVAANVGLSGLTVRALAIDFSTPATLYAGTNGGLFKSADSGGTWSAANTGLTNQNVLTLAINPSTPSTLYAGTSAGVFKSTDSGGIWAAVNTGLTNMYVNALAINPATPTTLYAGTDAGVFKSTDSGGSWAAYNKGLTNLNVNALALDPKGATTLFAGLSFGSVWQLTPPTGDATTAFLPSSARAPGAGGAFYTTDVTVANTGASDTQLTLKFLGNNQNGSGGAERSFTLAAGQSTTYADILGSIFGETTNFGAIRISSSSPSFVVLGQTSTPGFGGTFGQSVPAARPSDLITSGVPRSIVGVREDGAFRTNLILSNATSASLDVDVALFADTGANLGNKRYTLAPLGMTQVTRVVRDLGFPADVRGARVVLSTPTAGGSFAAYASAIDNITNDPRTLLPKGTSAGTGGTNTWFLPSSARAPGAGGAFYTTDLTVSNTGGIDTTFTLKFLGHDQDGTGGSEQTFALAAGKTVTYADVLGSVFGVSSGFGAIRITSPSASLNILGQTSTPGFGGTFGQSVPASAPEDLIVSGLSRSLVGIREDAAFRTNLILCNTTLASLDVDGLLFAADGMMLAPTRYTLPPLGMMQVTRVVRDMGVSGDVNGARLVLWTPTPAGAFAAYASAIDNTTNDPRTLLPR